MHHLNLAHGLAGRAIKDVLGQDTPISVTLNLHVTRAASDSPEDVEAKRRIDTIANEVFLRPMLDGEYPKEVFADTEAITDWSFVLDGDLDLIRVPLALLGINYYSTGRVQHGTPAGGDGTPGPDGHRSSENSPWVGATNVEFLPQPGPHTAMGWNIEPQGLVDLLLDVHERYPSVPMAITENGAAFYDEVSADGRVHDADRVAYLHDHIDAVGEAIERGADVRGYFVWSLMDNFEWSYGYDRRFGVVRVDYDTLERTRQGLGPLVPRAPAHERDPDPGVRRPLTATPDGPRRPSPTRELGRRRLHSRRRTPAPPRTHHAATSRTRSGSDPHECRTSLPTARQRPHSGEPRAPTSADVPRPWGRMGPWDDDRRSGRTAPSTSSSTSTGRPAAAAPSPRPTASGSSSRSAAPTASTAARAATSWSPPGTAHVVAWRTDGLFGEALDDRRHWHTSCWQARGRRGPTRR